MASVAGRYESWFLSARDAEPGRPPRALWIRHTTHRAADAETASGRALVHGLRPRGGRARRRSSSRCRELPPGGAGATRLPRRGAGARADGGVGPRADRRRPAAAPPAARRALPAPVPAHEARGAGARTGSPAGTLVLDGALVDVVGWRATVGHNWGAEHAERWVWLHAAGFEDEPDAWLELAIARVRIGGALSPWIANGAVAVGGRRFRLGGLGHVTGVRVIAAPGPPGGDRPRRARRDPRRRPRRPRPDRRLQVRGRDRRPGPRRARGPARRPRRGPPRHPPPRPQLRRAGHHVPAAPTSSAAATSPTASRCSPTPTREPATRFSVTCARARDAAARPA